jgi:hypothetical protein
MLDVITNRMISLRSSPSGSSSAAGNRRNTLIAAQLTAIDPAT